MSFALPALAALAAVAALAAPAVHGGGATAADAPYRCTDDTGMVLLTSDVGASRTCRLMATATRKCGGQPCPIRITKDQEGRLYINGTVNGTPVRYPVDSRTSAVTICIRGQCKAP